MVGQPLVVIQGPTASGKTRLAIAMAQALGGEIISADSRQVYRLMDIGTAKPSATERAAAQHHLLDLVYPDEEFTIADFLDHAHRTIDALHTSGRLPILAGGTGQYITALLEGWKIPRVPPNAALRQQLEEEAAHAGTERLYERLQSLDAAAAEAIHPNNVRRIVRALEVCIISGARFSDQQRKEPPPYTVIQIGLTSEREYLYARADQRFDQMMANGFLEEVSRLLDAGYARTLPAMTGLGYAELASHLLDDEPLDEAIQRAKYSTHQFIRRQFTWFRGHDRGVTWYDVAALEPDTLIRRTAYTLESIRHPR